MENEKLWKVIIVRCALLARANRSVRKRGQQQKYLHTERVDLLTGMQAMQAKTEIKPRMTGVAGILEIATTHRGPTSLPMP